MDYSLSITNDNLSNVFVYPNPVRFNREKTITFANLPTTAEIIIFNSKGLKIMQLKETNSDGGVIWDLKNNTGLIVPSGVYFYIVKSIFTYEINNVSTVSLLVNMLNMANLTVADITRATNKARVKTLREEGKQQTKENRESKKKSSSSNRKYLR